MDQLTLVLGVWLAYSVFVLCTLCFVFGVCSVLLGVHYIFLAYINVFLGVIGVCVIGMLYVLHLEFGMVNLIFSSQKMYRFGFLFSE